MGLFDKVREVVNTLQNSNAPLSDETERTYYEIAYGLLSLFSHVHYDGIKKYVEFHISQTCDEAKLQRALSNFGVEAAKKLYWRYATKEVLRSKKSGEKGFTDQKIEKLIEINQYLDESKKYRCSKEKAFDICYKDIFPEIKSEYEKVIEISETHGISHFREGAYRIIKKYQDRIGEYVLAEMIRSLTREKFIEGNHTVKIIVLAYLRLELCDKKITSFKKFRVASVALKALHFEAFGQTENEYSTISEEECKEFVLNNDMFISEIDEHPYDTDKYTREFIDNIINATLFDSLSVYDNFWMPLSKGDPYYADMVCNHFWKFVADKYDDGESTDINDVFDIIFDYATGEEA